MNLFESIKTAISSVLSNKMRTFLTTLGIIIGISSVIMITSIGNGIESMLNEEFSRIGSNIIAIYLKGWGENLKDSEKLRLDDVDIIKNHKNLVFAAPLVSTSGTIEAQRSGMTINLYIRGTTEDYKYSGKTEILYGRYINVSDYSSKSNVAVIDEWTAKMIFGNSNAVGKSFEVEIGDMDVDITIVGILKNEDNEMVSLYGQGSAIMPATAVCKIKDTDDVIDTIYVGVSDMSQINKTTKELVKLMEISHRSESGRYGVESYMEQIKSITNSLKMVTYFISFVAAISLLVGGIGVMNIMLVTVTERTREIGIRKSLGATNSNIRTQFMIEACLLSILGGIIGVILGNIGAIGIGSIIKSYSGMDFTPLASIPVILITVAISSAIGIIFGVYPASKAAKLDPIDALRYE